MEGGKKRRIGQTQSQLTTKLLSGHMAGAEDSPLSTFSGASEGTTMLSSNNKCSHNNLNVPHSKPSRDVLPRVLWLEGAQAIMSLFSCEHEVASTANMHISETSTAKIEE